MLVLSGSYSLDELQLALGAEFGPEIVTNLVPILESLGLCAKVCYLYLVKIGNFLTLMP